MEVRGIKEMEYVAADFVTKLTPQKHATAVGLKGDLGSGKTTFVQCVAKTFGIKEPVTSPTFVVQKIYNLKDQEFERLIHIDAYRLERARDLAALGWNELIKNAGDLIFVEWPENIQGALPEDTATITFTYVDADTRDLKVEKSK